MRIPTTERVRVWDGPTRLFHWAIVLLIAAAYVCWRLDWIDWHQRVGEAVLALVCFRLLWGWFGSETSRFSHFCASPAVALRHLRELLHREPDRQVGHNPAGGWMVLLLLALLLGETLTGVFVAYDVADEGPLTEHTPAVLANAISALHSLLWDALLAAVALHLLAVLTYAVAKGQNLAGPMITGFKRLPAGTPAPRVAAPWRAWMLAGCGALTAAFIVWLLSA